MCEIIQRRLSFVGDPSGGRTEFDGGLKRVPQNIAPSAVLDLSVLEQYRERERRGRKNLLSRIVDAYLQQSPQHIDQLRKAILNDNSLGVQSAAHTLKSSSANVGAISLSGLCKELEVQGRNCTTTGIKVLFSEVEIMHTKVCKALIEECEMLSV